MEEMFDHHRVTNCNLIVHHQEMFGHHLMTIHNMIVHDCIIFHAVLSPRHVISWFCAPNPPKSIHLQKFKMFNLTFSSTEKMLTINDMIIHGCIIFHAVMSPRHVTSWF